jgi:Nif-specific regulatory protein
VKPKVLENLYKISETINSIVDYDRLLISIMDIAIETVRAERGAIVLWDEKKKLAPVVVRELPTTTVQDLTQLSTSVINRALSTKKPVLLHSAQEDERFSKARSVVLHDIQSVIAVPLEYRGELIGSIYLDSRSKKGIFTEDDLEFVNAFANQAAIALENARLHKLLLAVTILPGGQGKKFRNIIGTSPAMERVFQLIQKVADSSVPVLIQGETGTGKELVARAIHYSGSRRENRLVPVYCGSLPETLLESELFGYKRGAFTGAIYDKKGLFEEADRGTLFLDEISDINLSIQAKLLRVLQEGEIRRLGETATRKVDVRIISSTNKILNEEVESGRFREDLYYRLQVVFIDLPPLRERREDIPLLADYFLAVYAKKAGKKIRGVSSATMEALVSHSWPGNVRELENTIDRACVLSSGPLIEPDDLKLEPHTENFSAGNLKAAAKDFEKEYLMKVLTEVKGHRALAAKRLGISKRTLQYKLKELSVEI